MHPTLARNCALFAQRLRSWDYRADLAELEELETADPAFLQRYRLKKLRVLLTHCGERVPFYRDTFKKLGFDPRAVQSEQDLEALPIITKDVLREDYSRFFSDGNTRSYAEWMTSGSTGQPFPFRLDRRAITRNTFAALARGRRGWGIEYGTPELMVWSGVRDVSDTFSGRLRALTRRISWRLKNIHLVDTYDLDAAKVHAAYCELLRFQPVVTRSISSGLYRFCQLLEELGLDGRKLGIRHAIYTGEAFPAVQKQLVERVLGCETICEYGCSELGVLGFECPEHRIHLVHENHIFEYRQDGLRAQAGDEAELLVTNLSDFVAPLIRYAPGDLVVPSRASCRCGRRAPLIDSVAGRAHAAIRTPSGAVVHGLFFTHLFDDFPIVHRFRVIQKTLFAIRLELTSTEKIPNSALDTILRRVQEVMGQNVDVTVEQVADLPLARSGKFRWIVSEIDSEDAQ